MNQPSITFQGNKLTLMGQPLEVGAKLPAFKLVGNDMGDVTNENFKNKKVLISVVPSLDTPVCAIETKKLNEQLGKMNDKLAVLTVSMDLPFAQKRWCGQENVENVITASDYKYRSFGEDFGVHIKEWGLLARAVFLADENGKVVYSEYVPEISAEPNYDAIMKAVESL